MNKNMAVTAVTLLVLSYAYPALAAQKNIYTDMDSGFTVQSANPYFEYASKHSYGYQEAKSTTNTIHSVVAIPADVVAQKIGQSFSTKEFMTKLAEEMKRTPDGKSGYAVFRPETYLSSEKNSSSADDALFYVFGSEELENGVLSCTTKTLGQTGYYVISLKYPGAYDAEKGIDKKASDIQLNITSDNNILYLIESYCSAENEESVQNNKDTGNTAKDVETGKADDGSIKSGILLSQDKAAEAMQNPKSLKKALIPMAASSLNDARLQKNLQKERDGALKNISLFKPSAAKNSFGANDPILQQNLSLPDNWMYLKVTPDMKRDEAKLNFIAAAPYKLMTGLAAMNTAADAGKDWNPDDLYAAYDEGLLLLSIKAAKRGKNFSGEELDELFKVPQSELQDVLDQMLPELTKNKKIEEFATFSNPKAKVTSDGELIRLQFNTNIKVANRYDFLAQSIFQATKEKGLLGLYIVKGDKVKSKTAANLAGNVKLLQK